MTPIRHAIFAGTAWCAALFMTIPTHAATPVPSERMNSTPPAKKLSAQVTLSRPDYSGWTGAYRLSNGTAEVIVVTQVARIMRYGYIGGANLLWNNATELGKPGDMSGNWRNFGGDKPWPWAQDDWPKWFGADWPPPVEADQTPQAVEVIGTATLRLTSPVMAKIGCRLVREITLAETGTRLYVVTKLERVADGFTDPVGAWTITQTPFVVPGTLKAGLVPSSTTLAEGWRIMGDKTPFTGVHRSPDGKQLIVQNDPNADTGRKLGFDGDTLSGVIGDTLLTIRADSPSAQGFEWRPGERGQIYVSDAKTGYIEWEFTSPMRPLKKGEAAILATTFEASPVPASTGTAKPK